MVAPGATVAAGTKQFGGRLSEGGQLGLDMGLRTLRHPLQQQFA
jgi:hypothetical protein